MSALLLQFKFFKDLWSEVRNRNRRIFVAFLAACKKVIRAGRDYVCYRAVRRTSLGYSADAGPTHAPEGFFVGAKRLAMPVTPHSSARSTSVESNENSDGVQKGSVVRNEPPQDSEYKVGPGRPPKEYQFKPGQSGNPKGAKRKAPSLIPDLKKIFEDAFNQKVTVTQGQRERVMTMWGAGMRQLSNQFARGRPARTARCLLDRGKTRAEFLTPKKAFDEILARDRQAILDAYVARQTDQNAPSAPVLAPPELLDDDIPGEAGGK